MARPGFVAYLFVVQCTTAVLCRCFYIRFVLPLIALFMRERREENSAAHVGMPSMRCNDKMAIGRRALSDAAACENFFLREQVIMQAISLP